MSMVYLLCVAALVLTGCAGHLTTLPPDVPMHTLTLRWQRLVDRSDQTCPRCSSTEQEMQKAFAHLKTALAPAGIAMELRTDRLDEATFFQAPLESNKVWINDRPLEDWLGGQTASSPCCGSCGDADCRTVSVGGQTYEAIPAGLIVRAGLIAAGDVLRGTAPADTASPALPTSWRGAQ